MMTSVVESSRPAQVVQRLVIYVEGRGGGYEGGDGKMAMGDGDERWRWR